MKKRTLALLAALLLLAGCGGGGGEAMEYDPATVPQALMDGGAFTEDLEALDADMVTTLYSLDTAPSAAAVYTSTGATAEELAVLKMPDAASAKATLEALKTRVADQKDAFADYGPEEIPKLDAAMLDLRGNTVLLVVAGDATKAQAALDGLDN